MNTSAYLVGQPPLTKRIGSELECTLLEFAKKLGYDYENWRVRKNQLFQTPFHKERRMMTTVIRSNDNQYCRIYVKGSFEKIIERSAGYRKSAKRVSGRFGTASRQQAWRLYSIRPTSYRFRISLYNPLQRETRVEKGDEYRFGPKVPRKEAPERRRQIETVWNPQDTRNELNKRVEELIDRTAYSVDENSVFVWNVDKDCILRELVEKMGGFGEIIGHHVLGPRTEEEKVRKRGV